MTEFENLKSHWAKQKQTDTPENGSQTIVRKTTSIKRKQVLTNLILISTLAVLILFFFYVSAYNSSRATLGLGIMISVLAIRIVLEIFSIRQLNRLKFDLETAMFKQKISNYYKRRIRTHYIFTPIIIAAYSFGFILLLPLFKESLSSGFYLYIKISAIFVLIGLVTLIGVQVKKELSALKGIKN